MVVVLFNAGIHFPVTPLLETIGKSESVAPEQTISVNVQFATPVQPGKYTARIDLVDQCVCWFEERGSEPLALTFLVDSKK